jgi:hypothetical protein
MLELITSATVSTFKGALNSSNTIAMEKSVQEHDTTLGLCHRKRSRCVTVTSSTVSTESHPITHSISLSRKYRMSELVTSATVSKFKGALNCSNTIAMEKSVQNMIQH